MVVTGTSTSIHVGVVDYVITVTSNYLDTLKGNL